MNNDDFMRWWIDEIHQAYSFLKNGGQFRSVRRTVIDEKIAVSTVYNHHGYETAIIEGTGEVGTLDSAIAIVSNIGDNGDDEQAKKIHAEFIEEILEGVRTFQCIGKIFPDGESRDVTFPVGEVNEVNIRDVSKEEVEAQWNYVVKKL